MFSNLKQTFNAPNTSFGFSSNVTPNPFGQTAFGKTPSTGFGAPASAFGQQSAPLFGQTSQHGSLFASAAPTNTFGQTVNTQPTFGTGMFGNASSQPSGSGLFGAANTSTFGQQNKTTGFGFGTNTANTGFGFGQSANPVQPQQQSTGLFGQTTSNLFGQSSAGFGANTGNNQIGTVIKFTPVTGTDTMVKGSINQTISTRHHCITCMKEYENKSLEELRWEDYQVNRKGPQQGAQPAGGLFGNMSQPVGTPLFGSGAVATSANTLFGQQENKSVFGQTATATGHGQYHPNPSDEELPYYPQCPVANSDNVNLIDCGQYQQNQHYSPSDQLPYYHLTTNSSGLPHYPADSRPPSPVYLTNTQYAKRPSNAPNARPSSPICRTNTQSARSPFYHPYARPPSAIYLPNTQSARHPSYRPDARPSSPICRTNRPPFFPPNARPPSPVYLIHTQSASHPPNALPLSPICPMNTQFAGHPSYPLDAQPPSPFYLTDTQLPSQPHYPPDSQHPSPPYHNNTQHSNQPDPSTAQTPSQFYYPSDAHDPSHPYNPVDPQFPNYHDHNNGFGQATPAFGATATSNTGAGLFGKPITGFGTATTSSAFPFSSTAQTNNLFGTNTAAKPAFGVSSQPNSLFGQPTGFANQSSFGSFGATTNQNVGLFNQNKTTPFSIMPTSTTNTFGSFAAPAAQNTNPLFSGAKPNTGFGGFGQTNTAPVFGQQFGQANQGGLFNSSFNKTATPLFGQTQTTNTLGTGLQMGGGTSLFGSNVNKPNTMFGNNLGLFNSGFGTSTNTGAFNMGGAATQPGVPNQDQSQTNTEQQIISMSSTPYGIPNLLNNISEVGTDLKDCTRPTNPGELNALLNTVTKTQQTTTPTEKLKPVQVFGRKVPMFDGLEHRDESLISNIRINNNPKRLIVRNHPNKNKDSLDDSLIRSTSNPIIIDSDFSNISNRSLVEDVPKERENLYPDLRALQKEMSPALQKSQKINDTKNTSMDLTATGNLPISSTMITSPSKALFLPETTTEDDNDSREEDGDLFAEASESQDWQTDQNDSSIRGLTDNNPPSTADSPASSGATTTTHPTGIILTRPEYFTVPSLDELVKYISEDGSCVVKGFTVGRYGYGNVYFSDAFDISNLNLDELVHFRHKEINIYPDDSKKPPQGQGLNRRAQVTLDKVWPLDKKAKALVTDVDNLTKMDYAGRLRRLCEKQNTRFVEYRPDTGSWVFKVEHFSKYGHRDSDEEEEVITEPEQATLGLKSVPSKTDNVTATTTTTPTAATITESADISTVTTAAPAFTTVIVSPKDNLGLSDIVDYTHRIMADEDDDIFTGLDDYDIYQSSAIHVLNGSAKCTLMKSTFFEKEVLDYDDNASDVCSSEGGILELSNYVSKSSPKRIETEDYDESGIPESEYIPLDICEDEIPDPADKPEVITIDSDSATLPAIKSFHNLADMIAFKGKSFRVGWTKQSTMLCLAKDEFDDDSTTDENVPRYRSIAFKKLVNTNIDALQNLERHLECQYNCSANEDRDGVPYCFPFYGNAKLHGHQCIANDLPRDNYEKQIWDLIATLFDYPEPEGIKCSSIGPKVVETCKTKVDKIRKNHLSRWIKSVVRTTVDSEVNDPNTDDISKILSYISGNKIDEAAELAMTSDNINLAMLISHLPTGRLAQVALRTQLNLWEKCDVYDHLDETVLKIYAILSGNTMIKSRGNKILVYEGMDWIRILALYFWYVIKREAPLSDAVNMYEKMFEENKLALPPSPEYEDAPENIYDLRFHLLKYYSDNGHSLTHLLNTFTHTNDPLDYRLSWFVFQTLQALNQDEVSTRARNHMHINFATQLEQMGLWHWAAYILTYIENNFLKRDMIVTLLGRHVQLRDEETEEYKHRERMVVHKFRIPQEWVEYEKAIKALQQQNYKDAIYYLCYARKWKRAHEIIMNFLIPKHLLSYDYEYLIELLTPISEHKELLSDWEEEGGLILDFAKLGVQYNTILSLRDPEAIKKQLISFRSAVINVSVRFKHFTPLTYLHDVCLAEMSGRIAVMLRKLLTIINGHTYELCVDTAINAQTLPMTSDYLKQELNSILIDFTNGNQPKMIYL